ncbi:MAG: hypothetical protein AAF821_00200 [Cyanobacteria bacterium P01_D01_bin.156]
MQQTHKQNKSGYRVPLSEATKAEIETRITHFLMSAGIMEQVTSDQNFSLKVSHGQYHPLTIRRNGSEIEFSQSGINNDGSFIGTELTFAIGRDGLLSFKDSLRFMNGPSLAPTFSESLLQQGFPNFVKAAVMQCQKSQLKL